MIMSQSFNELFAEEPQFQFDWKPIIIIVIMALVIFSLLKSVL